MKISLSLWIKSFFSFYSPRYPLKIIDKTYKTNKLSYIISATGESRPFVLSASEILDGKKIKEHLIPDDLISIVEDSINEKRMAFQYHLIETNRDGTHLLRNKNHEILISGEEFCRRTDLIEQTYPMDSYRIISIIYFNIGRNIEITINQKNKSSKKAPMLRILK